MARTLDLPAASRKPVVLAMGAALLGLTCLLALVATGHQNGTTALMEGLVLRNGLVEVPVRAPQLAEEEPEMKQYVVGDPDKVMKRDQPPVQDETDPEELVKILGFGAEIPEGEPNPRSVYYNVYEDDANLKEAAGSNMWHHYEPIEDPTAATSWWKAISPIY